MSAASSGKERIIDMPVIGRTVVHYWVVVVYISDILCSDHIVESVGKIRNY